ncbi:hypothetical protein GCM10023205_16320 [Yinghuangia aomiensis]|uniref:Uncharacterized protein n=1 Tax=Yinghuangia aomiensis TaxID=676205 RepID=A0ABP9GW91_9ACTN
MSAQESEKSRENGMWIRLSIYVLGFAVIFGTLVIVAATQR